MRLSEFDFELPPGRIATRPAAPRDAARLLCVGPEPAAGPGEFADRRIADLPELLRPGDLLVVNDTRVIPARLLGRRGEVRFEATLIEPTSPGRWRALVRPARRLHRGDIVIFAAGFEAIVLNRDGGEVEFEFEMTAKAVINRLRMHGSVPLPPYILATRVAGDTRAAVETETVDDTRITRQVDAADAADYQTMFAAAEGAVAAPTAGLHFTPALVRRLKARAIEIVPVTLHVGPASFLPVTAQVIDAHRMRAERALLSEGSAEALNRARAEGRRIVAVGSTSLRLIETACSEDGRVRPFEGRTALFIRPGYRFRITDLMVTNFHQPRSTLFMLVAAFAGLERIRRAYGHAIASHYRFYSYGDACLLERAR